jgi:hypothetical protein
LPDSISFSAIVAMCFVYCCMYAVDDEDRGVCLFVG